MVRSGLRSRAGRPHKEKGRPFGRPFHCHDRGPVGHEAPLTRGSTPHKQESRSQIPTTAVEDNETLDHLLSVVDDRMSMNLIRVFSKASNASSASLAAWIAGFVPMAGAQGGNFLTHARVA